VFALPKQVARSHRYRRIIKPRLKTAVQYMTSLFREIDKKQLLFVSGVQRSGTTLLLELLELSPEARVFHEGSRVAFENFMMRDVETIRRLYEKSPATLIALKALHEAHKLPSLLEAAPSAKAIWIYRHYDAVVRSTVRTWPGGRNQIDDVVRDPATGGWRGLGMSASTLATLRRHYRPDIDDYTAQALFWWWRNELVFDLGLAHDARVFILRYESLLRDPPQKIAELCRFAGLEPERTMPSIIRGERAAIPELPIEPSVRALCDAQLAKLDALAAGARAIR
jgi:hypothetical protein